MKINMNNFLLFVLILVLVLCFEIRSYCVAQVNIQLEILLSLSPLCYIYRNGALCSAPGFVCVCTLCVQQLKSQQDVSVSQSTCWPSLITWGTHVEKQRTNSHQLPSDLRIHHGMTLSYTPWHDFEQHPPHTHIINKCNILKSWF